jgi:hypothetical protein
MTESQEKIMKMKVQCMLAGLCLLCTLSAAEAQTASWKQVVGIIPATNVVGVGTGAVPGGFLPWTTTEGAAMVNLKTGTVRFSVRGLVFAGGSPTITIGTPGPVTAVRGILVCDTDGSAGGGNSVLVKTRSVALSATGDAAFSGHVDIPAVCSSESDIAFLVAASAFNGQEVPAGPWIANGAVLTRSSGDQR